MFNFNPQMLSNVASFGALYMMNNKENSLSNNTDIVTKNEKMNINLMISSNNNSKEKESNEQEIIAPKLLKIIYLGKKMSLKKNIDLKNNLWDIEDKNNSNYIYFNNYKFNLSNILVMNNKRHIINSEKYSDYEIQYIHKSETNTQNCNTLVFVFFISYNKKKGHFDKIIKNKDITSEKIIENVISANMISNYYYTYFYNNVRYIVFPKILNSNISINNEECQPKSNNDNNLEINSELMKIIISK